MIFMCHVELVSLVPCAEVIDMLDVSIIEVLIVIQIACSFNFSFHCNELVKT